MDVPYKYIQIKAYKHKLRKQGFCMIKLCSFEDKYEQGIGESYLCIPEYSYRRHMRMDDLKFAAAVAWSRRVVDCSSILIWTIAEEGILTTPIQVSRPHALCVGTMFLEGMIRWHNAVGLETKNTSPFVHAS
jgi:hypothetical protein